MWPYIQTVAGLAILVVAGDLLVRGAVSLAARLGVSKLIIGLTVVAFGTSGPELVVGIDAALSGVPVLSLGNVVGSNIANVLLVLGLPALFMPLMSSDHNISYNIGYMLAASVLLMGLAATGTIEAWHGVLLLLALIAFILLSIRHGRRMAYASHELKDIEGVPEKPYRLPLAIALTIAGLIGLAWGADLLVDGSTTIARRFGIPEVVIGLTLVAVGTSLPELVTSFMAALHRHGDIAIGNVVGSNIFNIFGILGITAILAPVPVPAIFHGFDLPVMTAAALTLAYFVLRRQPIGRWAGIAFIIAYIGYIIGLALLTPSSGVAT